MTEDEGTVQSRADAELVRALAAANGLSLTPERAAELVPALQAVLDADAQIAALHMGALSGVGLPWYGASPVQET